MRPLVYALALAALCGGCRTQPFDAPLASDAGAGDLAASDLAAVDLVSPLADLAAADLTAPPDDLSAPFCAGLSCDPATEVCVFLNRGDCSSYNCVPITGACANDRTCACLHDEFCGGFQMFMGETLTCTAGATFPPGPDVVVCTSSIQCI